MKTHHIRLREDLNDIKNGVYDLLTDEVTHIIDDMDKNLSKYVPGYDVSWRSSNTDIGDKVDRATDNFINALYKYYFANATRKFDNSKTFEMNQRAMDIIGAAVNNRNDNRAYKALDDFTEKVGLGMKRGILLDVYRRVGEPVSVSKKKDGTYDLVWRDGYERNFKGSTLNALGFDPE